MNKIISIILFSLFSGIGLLILPWYMIVPIALIFAYVGRFPPAQASIIFLFIGFIVWSGYALWLDHAASSRLSNKIGMLFGNQNVTTLIIVTGLIGGISSALGAWSGSIFRKYIGS